MSLADSIAKKMAADSGVETESDLEVKEAVTAKTEIAEIRNDDIVEKADEERFHFRHKTIARFSIDRYKFVNNHLTIVGADEADRFVSLVNDLPAVYRAPIVRINPAAAAAAESALGSSVVRGSMGTGDIKTIRGAAASLVK